MNTVVPPDFVFIYPDVIDEDGNTQGKENLFVPSGSWGDYSSAQPIDGGITAYVTHESLAILSLLVDAASSILTLHPPVPCPFFAIARYRVSLAGSTNQPPEWIFTCVGYLLPEIRVYLTILPTHTEVHTEPRSTPLAFA